MWRRIGDYNKLQTDIIKYINTRIEKRKKIIEYKKAQKLQQARDFHTQNITDNILSEPKPQVFDETNIINNQLELDTITESNISNNNSNEVKNISELSSIIPKKNTIKKHKKKHTYRWN